MSTTQEEIDSFHRFASEKLGSGRADFSMDELYRQWRSDQENADAIASIERGLADADTGRLRSMDEVDADVRNQLGFPARNK